MILDAARVAPEKAVIRPALPMSFLPGISEMQMATMTYKEQLQHPNWQRKRLEALESAGFECENCGDKETMLHVHHKRYVKGRKAWEYELTELHVLCAPCHESEHGDQDAIKAILAATDTASNASLLGGFHDHHDGVDRAVLNSTAESDALAFATGFTARIVYELGDIGKMREVAEFAASLHTQNAEGRMIFLHNRRNIFGEES